MTTQTAQADPGLGTGLTVGLGLGFVFGFLMTMFAFDWFGFELGKRIGEDRVNRLIDNAAHEAVLYKTTGFHNLREMIMAYEDREEVAIALRRFEADFLAERAAFLEARR